MNTIYLVVTNIPPIPPHEIWYLVPITLRSVILNAIKKTGLLLAVPNAIKEYIIDLSKLNADSPELTEHMPLGQAIWYALSTVVFPKVIL